MKKGEEKVEELHTEDRESSSVEVVVTHLNSPNIQALREILEALEKDERSELPRISVEVVVTHFDSPNMQALRENFEALEKDERSELPRIEERLELSKIQQDSDLSGVEQRIESPKGIDVEQKKLLSKRNSRRSTADQLPKPITPKIRRTSGKPKDSGHDKKSATALVEEHSPDKEGDRVRRTRSQSEKREGLDSLPKLNRTKSSGEKRKSVSSKNPVNRGVTFNGLSQHNTIIEWRKKVTGTFDSHVGKMAEGALLLLTDDGQKQAAFEAINTVLENLISKESFANGEELKKTLAKAITQTYPDDQDKLMHFLRDIQDEKIGLSDNHPLKTYKLQVTRQNSFPTSKRLEEKRTLSELTQHPKINAWKDGLGKKPISNSISNIGKL